MIRDFINTGVITQCCVGLPNQTNWTILLDHYSRGSKIFGEVARRWVWHRSDLGHNTARRSELVQVG
jgi:hypothetical protein